MASGLGMDLIEINRIERALDRHPRLAGRLFTDAELEYSRDRLRPGRHLAARFAAKEAVVKALGLGAEHACVVTDLGKVKCWGSNISAQLASGNRNAVGDGPNEMGDNLADVALP